MSAARSIATLAVGGVWQVSGGRVGGQRLLDATLSDDEDELMIAGMILSRGGEQTVDEVRRFLAAGHRPSVVMVDLLDELGGESALRDLAELAKSDDEVVAARAAAALADRRDR